MDQPQQVVDQQAQAQARLAFLELAVPQLREQRDNALDDVIRAKAEAKMHVDFLERRIAQLEAALKEAQAPKEPVPTTGEAA